MTSEPNPLPDLPSAEAICELKCSDLLKEALLRVTASGIYT